jgi:hypothetical protein
MFCSSCGVKNQNDFKFCTGCGAPSVAANRVEVPTTITPPVTPPPGGDPWTVQPTAPAPKRKNRFLVIGISAFTVVTLAVVAALFVFRPAPTIDTVDKYMMAAYDGAPTEFEETDFDSDWFDDARIFAKDCMWQEDINDLVEFGTAWDSISFERTDSDVNFLLATHQIGAFAVESTAIEYIETVRVASMTDGCLPNSPSPIVQSIQERFGIPVDGVYMQLDYEDSESLYSIAFARRGNVVTIVTVFSGDDSSNLYSQNVSIDEMEEMMRRVLERFNN